MSDIRYHVTPESIPVDRQTEVEIAMTLGRALGAVASIAFALPVVWNCQRYCVTFTKAPQAVEPQAPDYVAITSDGADFETSIEDIVLPSGTTKGHVKRIVGRIRNGGLKPGSQVILRLHHFRAPWLAEDGEVRVWINGAEQANTPRLRTTPDSAKRIRVILPSSCRPGEPFEVKIVSVDPFWNLSRSVFRNGILRVDGGEAIEGDIAFTGSYTTIVTLCNTGAYRLHFSAEPCEDTLLSNEAISNPIRITETPCGPFWGDLHGHDKMHNCGAGEDPLGYAREVSGLDFVCVAPDFRAFSDAVWQAHMDRVNEADDPGRFTAILGYEVGFNEGHHNVYFRAGEGEMWDTSDQTQWHIDALLSKLDPEMHFIVPHHVGVDWRPQARYHPERDVWIPLVEIYSQHGCGEMYAPEHVLAYEFNRTRGKEQKYASSVDQPVYVRNAWAQGRRYGVVASSDGHMGQPGKPMKGAAAVYASENTRDALFDSMRARRTYATTGERILIDFRINGAEMGREIEAAEGESLRFEIEINGTDQIAFVEVARLRFAEGTWERAFYERIVERNLFQEGKFVRDYDYSRHFEERFEGDVVYYLRMAQRRTIDDYPVFAWSSPIWVTGSALRG